MSRVQQIKRDYRCSVEEAEAIAKMEAHGLPPQVTAEKYPNRIVRRIVVIEREREAREIIIWTWDTPAEARQKMIEGLGL